MKPSVTLTDPVFSSRDIVASEPTPVTKAIAASATHGQTDIQMCGTYVPTPLLGTAYRFLNSSGTRLSVPNGEGELKPFRAFFVFSDLLGRKVSNTQPSHSPRIVIMNGRKTVERSR